jgi:hypothetical protein
MFDADFFRTFLPGRVQAECRARPDLVPVVRVSLADGTALDVCHISHLADTWMAVAYFRDVETCQEMDLAFFGYAIVTRVTLSLHHRAARKLGFKAGAQGEGTQTEEAAVVSATRKGDVGATRGLE